MNTRHQTTTAIATFVEILAPFVGETGGTSRSQDINPEDDLYGFLIGSWELDLVAYPDDGNVTHSTGEAHVARVLDGRAVQDHRGGSAECLTTRCSGAHRATQRHMSQFPLE
jgi:hypothetical protein